MIKIEDLQPTEKTNAISLAKELFLLSGEWMNVLGTTHQIKKGLLAILSQASPDAKISALPHLTNAADLENQPQFKDFDMPGSIRIAAQTLEQLADENATVASAVEAVNETLKDKIIQYWKCVFNEEDSILDFIDEYQITFNADGSISKHEVVMLDQKNYYFGWLSDINELTAQTVKAPAFLAETGALLATIFHWNNKDHNNLTIEDIVKKLIELNLNKTITADNGTKVTIVQKGIPENASISHEFNMVKLLGDLADSLAFSDNVDGFTNTEEFYHLKGLESLTAEFLKYAQELYSLHEVCDSSSVKEEHILLFSEWLGY